VSGYKHRGGSGPRHRGADIRRAAIFAEHDAGGEPAKRRTLAQREAAARRRALAAARVAAKEQTR